ncbi:hypothetical protein FKM82_018166 [Ascaphus truei]
MLYKTVSAALLRTIAGPSDLHVDLFLVNDPLPLEPRKSRFWPPLHVVCLGKDLPGLYVFASLYWFLLACWKPNLLALYS